MLDLPAVYRRCIFRSDQRSETHALVSGEFCDHRLRWHGDKIDTRFYKFHTPRLSLYSLRYGPAVDITPETYRGFSLVHFSLKKAISIQADGIRQDVPEGRAIISSPSRKIDLSWSNECEQIILRVPDEILLDAARELCQPDLFRQAKSKPGIQLGARASDQWQAQLQVFATLESYADAEPAFCGWLSHMERNIAMFLLLQGGDAPVPVFPETIRPVETTQVKARLDRLHAFAEAHLTAPVALSDMARATALSERQLNTICHEYFGMSPMAWLRTQRLDAVRGTLRSKPDSDIAAAAMLHGFFNLGRFAAYYYQRFGELPRQTVKFARTG